jgi:hypothetical protein
MSRKDYILIGNALKYTYAKECEYSDEQIHYGFFYEIVEDIANALHEDNQKFNKQKFKHYVLGEF